MGLYYATIIRSARYANDDSTLWLFMLISPTHMKPDIALHLGGALLIL
jgi:hypothetical protein